MDVTRRTAARLQRAARAMPNRWHGRAAILALKEAGYAHWKQMEWMGFYFQFLCEKTFADILDMPGPKHGRTEFDAFGSIPWDFKTHAANTTSHRVIANDTEAIEKAVAQHGYYGLILAIGWVEYNDEELTFKQWHDALKGGKSDYELKRIERGAMSRRRKTEFNLAEIHFIRLDRQALHACGGSFQKGFRNADGQLRRAKVTVNIQLLPDASVIATERF